jgi:YidC/Oxa1 family membrane protein insertase
MMNLLTTTIFHTLLWLQGITGNLGWSIVVLTLIIKTVLAPLNLPSLRAAKKIKDIQPELKKLKNLHSKDKQAYQKAQLELYKKHNINPLSGCIPQIVQLIVVIGLYRVLTTFLIDPQLNGARVDTMFYGLDLSKPDKSYVLPVLAAITQLVLSLMILPGGETPDVIPNKSKKKAVQEANKKEEDMAEMAATMQKQMLFIMPIMTGVIAISFPAGLPLYWIITTIFSVVQQYFVSGPGGLVIYFQRIKNFYKGEL